MMMIIIEDDGGGDDNDGGGGPCTVGVGLSSSIGHNDEEKSDSRDPGNVGVCEVKRLLTSSPPYGSHCGPREEGPLRTEHRRSSPHTDDLSAPAGLFREALGGMAPISSSD